MLELHLRVLDTSVHLVSDSAAVIQAVSTMLGRFRCEPGLPPRGHQLEMHLLSGWHECRDCPVPAVDNGRSIVLEAVKEGEGESYVAAVYGALVRGIYSRVSSHFLVHGGAVAAGEQGVVLVGGAGHGKTTLVLELARRGLRCMSDEIMALGRTDGLLYPFPRALHAAPESLELSGWRGLPSQGLAWSGKRAVDMAAIQSGISAEPVPLAHVIVLRGSRPRGQRQAFDGPASLHPLPSSRAVLALLADCQARGEQSLLRGELGGWGAVYAELARIIGASQCHELDIGPLGDMADLVCSLVRMPGRVRAPY